MIKNDYTRLERFGLFFACFAPLLLSLILYVAYQRNFSL